jgi:hypothetical protein
MPYQQPVAVSAVRLWKELVESLWIKLVEPYKLSLGQLSNGHQPVKAGYLATTTDLT